MDKIKASVVVIGFQKEDHRMYPHLYDFLQNLKGAYNEVIYIEDDDRGEGLYNLDLLIQNILSVSNFKRFLHKVYVKLSSYFVKGQIKNVNLEYRKPLSVAIDNPSILSSGRNIVNMLIKFISYVSKRRRLIKKIKSLNLEYDKNIIVAIDHTATYFAEKYFPGMVIFWSIDILAEDNPWRVKNGFLEKLITSEYALKSKVLMIQDENRKKLLEESFGVSFPNTIYLPVSLNDSEFCRKAAEIRRKKDSFHTVNIIQNGWIVENRWSDQLIDVYRNWPDCYKLHLHGFMGDKMESRIKNAQRKPDVSTLIYDSDRLSQMLNNYDIGFVGYNEPDINFNHIENASSQMVMFLRLGIPVIGYGYDLFNDFVNKNNIGIGISTIGEMENAIKKIIDNYPFFSYTARRMYELKYNLKSIFNNYLIKFFESLFNKNIKTMKEY